MRIFQVESIALDAVYNMKMESASRSLQIEFSKSFQAPERRERLSGWVWG